MLADHHLNLTKLESRPRPNVPWEYLFYVDFEGGLGDAEVDAALTELTARTRFLKVLGSYPARNTRKTRPAEPRRPAGGRPKARPQTPGETRPAPAVLQALSADSRYRLASRSHREQDTVIRVGASLIGGERPVIIAGPGAVESEAQIQAAAALVAGHGAHLLRGGCFPPRSSPYAFEGLGYEGLDLLEHAGRAVSLPIVTAVTHPGDVERVARQADVLRVGGQDMQNFALLEAVGATDRPVILERGLMAAVDEWLAAAEAILAGGNQQVILCERGIRTFETATRATLDLTIVPVVRERSHLPVLVDPSHAAGAQRWIGPLAEAALACGASGLMLEVHPTPAESVGGARDALDEPTWAALMERLAAWL